MLAYKLSEHYEKLFKNCFEIDRNLETYSVIFQNLRQRTFYFYVFLKYFEHLSAKFINYTIKQVFFNTNIFQQILSV